MAAALLAAAVAAQGCGGCGAGGGADLGEACTTTTDCMPGLVCAPASGTCTQADAGTSETDAVPPAIDSSSGSDAGSPGTDASATGTDAAPPGTDAAATGTDAAPTGTDAALPGSDAAVPLCGNGTAEGPEVCDGADLRGEDCATLGVGFTTGSLSCSFTCDFFDTAGCMGDIAAPALRRPMNGAYVYTLAPTFFWDTVTAPGGAPVSYEIDYTTDSTFASGVTTMATSAGSYTVPADLPASLIPPVGAIYFWRVRACASGACSPYGGPWSVSLGRRAYDLNGDGYDDVFVTNGYSPSDMSPPDSVEVYFGGPGATLDETADVVFSPIRVGLCPPVVGDVNRDGFADVLLLPMLPVEDHVDLYLGSAAPDTVPDMAFDGEVAGDLFGGWITESDTDGDAFPEVIILAAGNDAGGTDAGRLYVYSNVAGTIDSTADVVFTGSSAAPLGMRLLGAGDLDGDGVGDLVASRSTPPAIEVYGGGPLDLVADASFSPTPDSYLTVAPAGDVNADGFSDLVVGAPSFDEFGPTFPNSGRAYVYLGGAASTFDDVPDGILASPGIEDWFGDPISTAGDLNGDGYDDIIIAAPHVNDLGASPPIPGFVKMYLGGPGSAFDSTADTILGPPAGPGAGISLYGFWIAGAGDVNGDGYSDIAVILRSLGEDLLYFGGPGTSLDATPDFDISAPWYGLQIL